MGSRHFVSLATTTPSVTCGGFGISAAAFSVTLAVSDRSTTAPGRLVNGTFSLPELLQAAGSTSGTYAMLPATLKTYAGPASNDAVAVSFKQPVKAKGYYRQIVTICKDAAADRPELVYARKMAK